MKFIRGYEKNIEIMYRIVHATIDYVYPKYYPNDVVQFFKDHHSRTNIMKALQDEYVLLLELDGQVLGTGSLLKNEIKRMFILPEYQGKGYGSLLLEKLEDKARVDGYEMCVLDASLPGHSLYVKKGYNQVKQNRIITESGCVLCYSEMTKAICNKGYLINYNNRVFTSISNSDNGEVSSSTIFKYRQQNNIIWAEYSGGEIEKGYLIGTIDKNSNLNFTYQHINIENQIRTGKCRSTPEVLNDGRLKLLEEWEWTNGDKSKGTSELIEIVTGKLL